MIARFALFAALVTFAPVVATAASVDLEPVRDNTLFQIADGSLSNGAGEQLYVGLTNQAPEFALRRALLQFDLTSIPGGSTVTNVTLKLHCSNLSLPPSPPTMPLTLHRVSATWGEGASDAGQPGGSGAAAELGDATWLYRFYDTILWDAPGGTFQPTASASQTITGVGFYTVGPSAQLTQDAQVWVNVPNANFGWMLRGNEGTAGARRFESRNAQTVSFRPVLHVDYNPATGVEPSAGRIEFGVRAIEPNPVSRAARVSLTLASSDPARLEVVDLAGRRLAGREVGSLGPGEHLVNFPELAQARAGIYWVRLTQGARTAMAKAAVMP